MAASSRTSTRQAVRRSGRRTCLSTVCVTLGALSVFSICLETAFVGITRSDNGSAGQFVGSRGPPVVRTSSGLAALADGNAVDALWAADGQFSRRRSWWPMKASATMTAPPVEMTIYEASNQAAAEVVMSAGKKVMTAAGVVGGLIGLLVATSAAGEFTHRHMGSLIGTNPIVAGASGLAVGALHTLAGPDHFAGLAPLVIGQRRSPLEAFGLGAFWGSGHATGQLLIGLACLLVKVGFISGAGAAAMGTCSGLLVGVSLIAIGALGYHESRQFEDLEAMASDAKKPKGRYGWATYATGVLHGLSPDALLFMVPALTLPRLAATLHVTGVVAGTLLSMGLCTATLGLLCQRGLGSGGIRRVSTCASGTAALLGVVILAATLGVNVTLPGF